MALKYLMTSKCHRKCQLKFYPLSPTVFPCQHFGPGLLFCPTAAFWKGSATAGTESIHWEAQGVMMTEEVKYHDPRSN